MTILFTRQQPQKTKPRDLSLADWMCYEAESVVQYNFNDVAVWDRKLLEKTNIGETRLWWIHAFGSQFLPMYCRICEKAKSENEDYSFSAIEINLLRLLKDDQLSKIQNKIILESSKFFFITKGCRDSRHQITSTTFNEVVDIAFCGKANLFLN